VAQGTIKHFDEESREGSLLLDDRTEVSIDPISTEGAGIRVLRVGQRVKFDLAEEGGKKLARRLTIITF
jgi:cold shock CspA family protein